MSKLIIIFTIILLILTTIFIKLNSHSNQNLPTTNNSQLSTILPTPRTACALIMSPEKITIQPNQKFSINITIGSDGDYPTDLQLEIAYDPNVLTNAQIYPGNLFTNPIIPLNYIDPTTGRISYAIQLPPDAKTTKRSGTVATLSFMSNPNTQQRQTKIYFLPKTTVHAQGQTALIKEALGSEILVSLPPNTATPSPQLNPQTPPTTMPSQKLQKI